MHRRSPFLVDLFVETINEWDEDAVDCYQPGMPLTFKRDFGPWKRGHKAFRINFDFFAGTVAEWDEEGNQLAGTTFLLSAN